MIKTQVQFKGTSNGRESYWYLDNDCPIADTKEMLFQFQKAIGQIEDNIKAQLEAQKQAEEAKKVKESGPQGTEEPKPVEG